MMSECSTDATSNGKWNLRSTEQTRRAFVFERWPLCFPAPKQIFYCRIVGSSHFALGHINSEGTIAKQATFGYVIFESVFPVYLHMLSISHLAK